MAFEEKRAWIMLVVSVVVYAAYVAVTLGRVGDGSLAEVSYVAPLLWSIGAAIVASIVLGIAAAATTPEHSRKRDERDREIERFGDRIGQSFLVIGGITALLMSMAELDHFWIANAVYLAFVLSAVLSSVAKLFAYRGSFQQW